MNEKVLAELTIIRKAMENLNESYKQIAEVNTANLALNTIVFAWQMTGHKELTAGECKSLFVDALKSATDMFGPTPETAAQGERRE